MIEQKKGENNENYIFYHFLFNFPSGKREWEKNII